MKMRIKGTGSFLPEKILTNDDLSEIVDTSDQWIRERTGITKRHISIGEGVADLAAEAGIKALESAGKNPEDVELIIVATCSPEMLLPCAACIVQEKIGAVNAAAFDINAACSGFLIALNTVYGYLLSGLYENALIIGAEVLSKIVDWSDRGTCVLFGDGAGAVYVESEEGENNYHFVQHANGSKGMVLKCDSHSLQNPLVKQDEFNRYVSMDGREIFKFAVSQIPKCIEELINKTDFNLSDVDYFILHQANLRIITSIAKKLGIDMDKVPTNVEEVGNMSSAAIPVLLDELVRRGMIKKGMILALSGFGAGLTYGASVIEW